MAKGPLVEWPAAPRTGIGSAVECSPTTPRCAPRPGGAWAVRGAGPTLARRRETVCDSPPRRDGCKSTASIANSSSMCSPSALNPQRRSVNPCGDKPGSPRLVMNCAVGNRPSRSSADKPSKKTWITSPGGASIDRQRTSGTTWSPPGFVTMSSSSSGRKRGGSSRNDRPTAPHHCRRGATAAIALRACRTPEPGAGMGGAEKVRFSRSLNRR
ncbi:hypothetical protein Ddc_22501 [Ditylenchus destructor]|nr:hypothetical protein Ddc_22501 [Ditylenchus destructor]